MRTTVWSLGVVALALLTPALRARQDAPGLGPSGPEPHLANIRQLTFGGENAEAYFSFDGSRLTFQSSRDGNDCDQIYTMQTDGSDVRRIIGEAVHIYRST